MCARIRRVGLRTRFARRGKRRQLYFNTDMLYAARCGCPARGGKIFVPAANPCICRGAVLPRRQRLFAVVARQGGVAGIALTADPIAPFAANSFVHRRSLLCPAGICADICPVQWSPLLRAAQSEVRRGCRVAVCVGHTGQGRNIIYLARMKRAATACGSFIWEWGGGKPFLPQSIVSGAAYAAPNAKCAAGPRHKMLCSSRDGIMRRSMEKMLLPRAAKLRGHCAALYPSRAL